MPGQPYPLPLNDGQLARMITIAARPPAENAARITAEDGGLGLIGVLSSTCDGLVGLTSLDFSRLRRLTNSHRLPLG